MPQREYLAKLPREIWEQVFDHLGLNLNSLQLTCRFFREIAARRRWSNVNITQYNCPSEPCTLLVTRHNIKEGVGIMSAATKYVNKLSVSPGHSILGDYDDSEMVKLTRLAMSSASEVVLKADARTFTSDPVGIELLDDFRHLRSDKKLIVKLFGWVTLREGPRELIQTIRLLETFTSSIEVELHVEELGEIAGNDQLMRYVKSLYMRAKSIQQDMLEELLQICPRVEYLASTFSAPGRVVLPECTSAFEAYGCSRLWGGAVMVTVTSKFVTRFRVQPAVLERANTFDFPNLQTLELLLLVGTNGPVISDRVMGALQQLTKNLERLVIDHAEGCLLKQIFPLVANITEEISIMKIDGYELRNWKDYREYVRSLFDFTASSPKARVVRLQIPLMEPQSMKAVIKALVQRCPHLGSLFTTDKYPHQKMDVLCPYMHKVPYDPTLDFPLMFRTYEVDVQYIRGLRVPEYSDMNELLVSMDLRAYSSICQ
ncbi:hypothetical protein TRVA0_019S00958 [Trichomonascus vanleenenianus]|uniref:F-box protein n=1 Tax=Trichomonascus vanleenenianus TaxID=2268995 RepID=UPI003ECADE3A